MSRVRKKSKVRAPRRAANKGPAHIILKYGWGAASGAWKRRRRRCRSVKPARPVAVGVSRAPRAEPIASILSRRACFPCSAPFTCRPVLGDLLCAFFRDSSHPARLSVMKHFIRLALLLGKRLDANFSTPALNNVSSRNAVLLV